MRYMSNSKCKMHLNKSNKKINIESNTNLAKYAIKYIVIAKINCYQTAIDKAFYLNITDIRDIFSVSWYLVNSLDTK